VPLHHRRAILAHSKIPRLYFTGVITCDEIVLVYTQDSVDRVVVSMFIV